MGVKVLTTNDEFVSFPTISLPILPQQSTFCTQEILCVLLHCYFTYDFLFKEEVTLTRDSVRFFATIFGPKSSIPVSLSGFPSPVNLHRKAGAGEAVTVYYLLVSAVVCYGCQLFRFQLKHVNSDYFQYFFYLRNTIYETAVDCTCSSCLLQFSPKHLLNPVYK